MTIQDEFLVNIAKAVSGESFSYPSHLAVAEGNNTNLPTSATSLVGEIGTRKSLSVARIGDTVTWTAVRTTADVVDTSDGDDLTAVGITTDLAGSTLQLSAPISELQTINFDLEVIWELQVRR